MFSVSHPRNLRNNISAHGSRNGPQAVSPTQCVDSKGWSPSKSCETSASCPRLCTLVPRPVVDNCDVVPHGVGMRVGTGKNIYNSQGRTDHCCSDLLHLRLAKTEREILSGSQRRHHRWTVLLKWCPWWHGGLHFVSLRLWTQWLRMLSLLTALFPGLKSGSPQPPTI